MVGTLAPVPQSRFRILAPFEGDVSDASGTHRHVRHARVLLLISFPIRARTKRTRNRLTTGVSCALLSVRGHSGCDQANKQGHRGKDGNHGDLPPETFKLSHG